VNQILIQNNRRTRVDTSVIRKHPSPDYANDICTLPWTVVFYRPLSAK